MLSGGSDGQRVEVVGQDAPSGPGLLAVIAFEAAAAHAVAAFEVADASLGAGAVALQPALGATGAGLLAPGDEDPFGLQVFELLGCRAEREATVQRDLPWRQPEPRQLGHGLREQLVLAGVAGQRRCRQDQSACAALGVRRDLGDLRDVAELVGLAELALADRPRVGVR